MTTLGQCGLCSFELNKFSGQADICQCQDRCTAHFHVSCLREVLHIYSTDGNRFRCPSCFFVVPSFRLVSFPWIAMTAPYKFALIAPSPQPSTQSVWLIPKAFNLLANDERGWKNRVLSHRRVSLMRFNPSHTILRNISFVCQWRESYGL